MRGEHVPETEEYGISSFSYLARRPFHPKKFYDFLHGTEGYGKLLRSKAISGWLPVQSLPVNGVRRGIARYGYGGMFWSATPRSRWPDDPEYLESIEKSWVEPFGDMRQELVFIGQGLDEVAMTAALDDCLLTDDELLAGREFWRTLPDPFPSWDEAA